MLHEYHLSIDGTEYSTVELVDVGMIYKLLATSFSGSSKDIVKPAFLQLTVND